MINIETTKAVEAIEKELSGLVGQPIDDNTREAIVEHLVIWAALSSAMGVDVFVEEPGPMVKWWDKTHGELTVNMVLVPTSK